MTGFYEDPFALPGYAPRERQRPEEELPERSDSLSFGDVAGDLLAAPFRGIEGAIQGVAGLFGADYEHDYVNDLFGERKTIAGNFLEGATQFFVGFLPALRGLNALKYLGVGAQAAAKSSKIAKGIELTRYALAGAAADATVFDGHEGRLSDFIAAYPALENPITNFLASGENDSQALGRFKNTLEGLGLGLAVDMLVPGLKSLREYRKQLAAGADREAASAAAEKVLFETDLEKALKGKKDIEVPKDPTEDQLYDVLDETRRRQASEELDAELATEADQRFPTATAESGGEGLAPKALRELGIDDDAVDTIWSKVKRRNEKDWPADINPRERVRNDVTGELEYRYSDADLLYMELNRGDLNLSKFGNLDATQLMRVLEGVYSRVYDEDLLAGNRTGLSEVTERAALEVAGAANTSSDAVKAIASKGSHLVASARTVNIQIQTFRTALHVLSQDMVDTMRKARSVDGSAADRVKALETMRVLAESLGQMKALSAEQSRILGNNRARIPGADFVKSLTPEKVAELLDGAGSERAVNKLFDRFLAMTDESGKVDIEGVGKMIEASGTRRIIDALNEVFVESVISGGKTFTVNAVSGVATAIYRPLEIMLGAGFRGLLGKPGAAREIQIALKELGGIFSGENIMEALRAGKVAYQLEDSVLTSSRNRILDPGFKQGAVSGKLLPPQLRNTRAGVGLDWIGRNVIRQPTRLLGGADEFLKNLSYRAVTNAALYRESLEKGLGPEWIATQRAKMIINGQAYAKERLIEQGFREAKAKGLLDPIKARDFAEAYAEENFDERLSAIADFAVQRAAEDTFTNRLEKGTLGRSVQDFLDTHPALRPIMPFVRTPTNLLKFVGQRFDYYGYAQYGLASVSPSVAKRLEGHRRRVYREMTTGDERAKTEATGRLVAGAMFSITALNLAAQGKITGAGPEDPEQRRLLQQAGWLPYSIKVGDGYVQYNRLDPFAAFLGIAADSLEYSKWAGPEAKGVIEEFSSAILVALTNNFTQKSYFTGLSAFLQAATEPQRYMPKLKQRYAAAFVPNILGQSVTPLFDDQMHDIRGVADAMLAKVPGFSKDLAPYRNVLGEPVFRQKAWGSDKLPILDAFLPFAYRATNDDVISRELAALGHGFTPASPVRNEQDLFAFTSRSGQTAYDRWGELQGSVKLSGRTLREDLKKLFRSGNYKRMPEPDAFEGLQSPRIAEVNKVIQRYRREAFRQVLREYPDLNAAIQDRHERRRAAKLGLLRR